MSTSRATALRAMCLIANAVWLASCSGRPGEIAATTSALPATSPVLSPLSVLAKRASPKVQHVVVIIQENRTVDNLFHGFPGADTRSYGFDRKGTRIRLKPVGLEAAWDFHHDSSSFFAACDGQGSYPGTNCKMDGFDQEYWTCGKSGYPPCPNQNPPYSYVPHAETLPYFAMGKQYVFADRMFGSNFDSGSFASHQYIIAAQASATVDYPYGQWGCEGGSGDMIRTVTQQRQLGGYIQTCLDNTTLGDELDSAGLSWRYYASDIYGDGGAWSAYQAIRHVFNGPDWGQDVITPQTQFFADVSNGALPTVSWISPTCENSDHAGCGANTGPAWVASLVNAIGESQYWDSTVVFVFWDDYGGWYDHVPPKLVDYDGLGIRVPLLVISAYAKQGYVSHLRYEHGSILKFIEDQFGLPRLSASDSRANSPGKDCFQFSKPPRAFTPIQSPHGKEYFLRQPIDTRPLDAY